MANCESLSGTDIMKIFCRPWDLRITSYTTYHTISTIKDSTRFSQVSHISNRFYPSRLHFKQIAFRSANYPYEHFTLKGKLALSL